jgi:putative transposase
MKRSYKYRIYPNKNQEVKLIKTLNTCRHLYNSALAERKQQAELYQLPLPRDWINYTEQANNLATSKTSEQKEVFSQVLQDVLRRLDKNFKNFFNGNGYPRFKGKNRYNSFTYPQFGFSLENGKLTLSKIGSIKIVQHREIKGKIKTCTIKRDVDQWYAIFVVEIEKTVPEIEVKTKVGVDVGLSSLITLSNGEQIAPPQFFRKAEGKLTKEQRRLSRKEKGSANREKQCIKVARAHRKIRNQRCDFTHKLSRALVNRFDLIAFENLNIKGMARNHHLAKSISDAGWYQLQSFTTYKAAEAGKQVKFCLANGTSQECHVCGNIQKMTLKDRVFRCSICGNVENRDLNSSNVILNRCTAGTAGIEACQSGLTRDMMKQEAPSVREG